MTAAPLHIVQPADDPRELWEATARRWRRSLSAKNLTDTTIDSYLASVTRLALWSTEIADRAIADPADMTKPDLEDFYAWALTRTTRTGRKAKPGAVAKDFRCLRVFFRWLVSTDELDESPHDKLSGIRVPKTPVDVLDDDELRELVATCRGRGFVQRRDMAMLRLLIDTGMRRSELAGICRDDVDVDAQLVTVMGKGRKPRTIPYGARAAEAIDLYLASRAKHPQRSLATLWLQDPARSRGALGIDGVRYMLDRRAGQAGIGHVHPHRFRHTAAHAWLMAGGTEGDAMRLFGWDSRDMLDRYGAAASSSRAIAAKRKLSPGDRI